MLFEIVCKYKHDPLHDHRNLWLWLRRCLHCHGWCYSKSSANVRILNSTTMTIYDYSWDSAYVVMDDGWYLKLFAKVRTSHYSTIRIYDYSWHCLYVIMDDAVRNRSRTSIRGRLQDRRNLWLWFRWCAQCHGWCYLKSIATARMTHSRTIESMIMAETVFTLSWTILFEIACESAHDPLQEH